MAADVLAPGFWEVGSYKHNVRRIKEGVDQLDDFSKMTRERAEIEAKYGKALQQFSERWRGHVEKTVQEGSVRSAWTELLSEADALALQHTRVKDRLLDEVVKTVALYRKEHHHSSAFRAPKEIREIDESFEKAQRQWKKLFEKLETAKKAYHSACRQEKSALVNLNNCQADTAISADGAQKFRDRLDKTKEEVSKTRTNYHKQLEEVTQYRATYIQSMTFVFEKCQQVELRRSKFFIEMVSASQTVLVDLLRSTKFSQLHSQIEAFLRNTDDYALNKDLKQWSQVNGIDAPTEWPAFDEYTPEMRTIGANKGPSRTESGGVILTRQVIKTDDIPSVPGPASGSNHSDYGKNTSDSDTNTFDSRKTNNTNHKIEATNGKHWEDREASDSPPLSATTPDSEKYGEFDEFQFKGLMANVLYDYTPLENDEIALKKGETIEVITEADNLGWCTGRRNGEVGLFPASYVAII